MEEKIEEIIFLLMNNNKLKDMTLGVELAKIFTKNKKSDFKIETIKEKLYDRYIDMLDPEIGSQLIENSQALKGAIDNLYSQTFWSIDEDGNFYFNGETLKRTAEGYELDTPMKLRFYSNFETELNVIHNLLLEKESLLNPAPPLKEGENEKLANLIREIVFTHVEDLKATKRIYGKRK